MTPPRVAYPGSFDPPTIAHLAVARAAHHHLTGATVSLVVSRVALGKEGRTGPALDDRISVLRAAATDHPWLGVEVTDLTFVAEIAEGYDAVVVGADKWRQVIDPRWYADAEECRRMRTRLPRVLVVPRAGDRLDDLEPTDNLEVLSLDEHLSHVSSSAARLGELDLMLPAAREFALRTGHWIPTDGEP